jgi:hypothetical protein
MTVYRRRVWPRKARHLAVALYPSSAGIVGAGGIASAEAFGGPSIGPTITGGTIASAEAFGGPSLSPSVIGAGGIVSAEAFGGPTVTPVTGAQEITGAGGITSLEAFGGASIRPVITGGTISSSEAFGLPIIDTGVWIVGAGGITTGESFGGPSLRALISGGSIASLEAFGLPIIGKNMQATLPSISARYGGAGSVARHYRFGVVAVGTRKSGTIPCASGVVESSEAVPSPGSGTWQDAVFAPEITDVAFRSYQGQGVQRRAIQIDAESIDFIDAPDTSPTTDELLQARIGRLGVGGAILMDGTYYTPINGFPISSPLAISTGGTFPSYLPNPNKDKDFILYDKVVTGTHYYYYRKWNSATLTYASEVLIDTPTPVPGTKYIIKGANFSDSDRKIFITSGLTIQQLTWNGSSFASKTQIINESGSASIELGCVLNINGTWTLFYVNRPSSGSTQTQIKAIQYNGSSWGSPYVVKALSATMIYYNLTGIVASDGSIRIAFTNNYDYSLNEILYVIDDFGAPTSIATYADYGATYAETLTGKLFLLYTTSSGAMPFRKIQLFGGTWSSPTTLITTGPTYPSTELLPTGNILLSSGAQEWEILLNAQLGAGIIEFGSNTYGSYIKFSDGTLEAWFESSGTYSASGLSGVVVLNGVATPATFVGTAAVLAYTKYATGVSAWANGFMSSSLVTVVIFANAAATAYVGYHAIGRWK